MRKTPDIPNSAKPPPLPFSQHRWSGISAVRSGHVCPASELPARQILSFPGHHGSTTPVAWLAPFRRAGRLKEGHTPFPYNTKEVGLENEGVPAMAARPFI